MTAQNDEAIVRTILNGRKEAFADLVNRYKDSVYGTLMKLTADPQTAEELAHETFVRAYQNLSTFRGESRLGTWLTRIAINLARDHVRERRRNRTVSLEAMVEQDPDAPAFAEQKSCSDPLGEVDSRDMLARFETVLQELPPSYRETFVLHHVQDMPYEDIASLTGDSVGSLKVRAHRARKLLKERLFPDMNHADPGDILR